MLFSAIYTFTLLALSTVVFAQSGLSRPACTSCTSTIVQTTTTRLTTVKTTTILTTRTIWVTKPTVAVITRTSVVIRISTRVVSSTSWRRTTTTVTKTVSTTTTLPSQTCLSSRALDIRQVDTTLPKICSCYLTATRKTGVYTILTSFLLPNATNTIRITSTKTTTSTRVTTTRTSQTVSLRTSVNTTSTTVWRTSTTTIVSTRAARQTFAAACNSPLVYSRQLFTANIENSAAVKVHDFKNCCNRCFAAEGVTVTSTEMQPKIVFCGIPKICWLRNGVLATRQADLQSG
ncbi:uncharacterized protein DFL_003471 [Arthrobotrys flagrans]|uniref:Apple domain-containing protein n=1 Tax=Arthrobotrys flagrans TaxID=97331 RepID=A0A437A232_ARTFL|nr:hypothetical protein DFL_003471 [Arthrobotrys flagrans]